MERLRQLESIYHAISDVIFVLSVEPGPRYRFISANAAFFSTTGLSQGQVLGKWVDEVIPEPSLSLVLSKYALAIREGQAVRWEETSDYPTGRLTGEVTVVPVLDEGGRCTSLVGSVHDVTDYKKAVAVRDEFISMASHELKTPLTALNLEVSLRLERLKQGKVPGGYGPSELIEVWESFERKLWRLELWVDELLDATRIRSGGLWVHPEEMDLVTLAHETVGRLRGVLESSRCEVKIQGDAAAIGRWDRVRLEQVLTNLLSNAAKFGAGKRIEMEISVTSQEAELRVRDFGIGIAEGDQKRIFDQFEQVDSGVRREGLGLGLYVVKHIVDAHGGRIWVESSLGQGATFVIRLPRAGMGSPETLGKNSG